MDKFANRLWKAMGSEDHFDLRGQELYGQRGGYVKFLKDLGLPVEFIQRWGKWDRGCEKMEDASKEFRTDFARRFQEIMSQSDRRSVRRPKFPKMEEDEYRRVVHEFGNQIREKINKIVHTTDTTVPPQIRWIGGRPPQK